ncbi:MAG: hypothetical protein ACP5EP_08780 [Acidobacteriaceae bacterium]
MDADWSVECGADGPLVVIPWRNATGTLAYIDLRRFPGAICEIPEAVQWPTLAEALLRWNQTESPIFTAKCDVWAYPAGLFDAEDLPGFAFAQGCYIDLVPNAPEIFASFPAAEAQLRRWTGAAHALAGTDARCEWTLRRALLAEADNLPVPPPGGTYKEGFATTLYVWGYGPSPETAATAWGRALEGLIGPVLDCFGPSI